MMQRLRFHRFVLEFFHLMRRATNESSVVAERISFVKSTPAMRLDVLISARSRMHSYSASM